MKILKETMTNKYIDYIIACEANRLKIHNDPFIKNGYMGLCLFLFYMYEITSNKKYYDLAQEFLRHSCSSIKQRSRVNIANGLSGIGLSVIYLYKKEFITGDIYEILKNVDNEIYKNVMQTIDNNNFSLNGHEEALMDVALYMIERVNVCNLSQTEEKILELFISKIINKLYQEHDSTFYLEPIPYVSNYKLARFILLLSKAHSIKICKNRVLHIWEESRRTILSQSPYLDCNKLLLLYAFVELQKNISNDERLNTTILTFKKDISISQILSNEIPANSMSILSGLPGIISLLMKLKILSSNADRDLIIKKIKSSCFYNMQYEEIIENKFIGLNGILGYIYMYLNIRECYAALC